MNQQNFGLLGCWIDQQIDLQKYADFSGIIAAGQQISQFVCRSENNIVLLDLAAVAVGTRYDHYVWVSDDNETATVKYPR